MLTAKNKRISVYCVRFAIPAGLEGGAPCPRSPHSTRLARDGFKLPVASGRASTVSGVKNALDEPEFATPGGLIMFGAVQAYASPRRGGIGRVIRRQVAALFGR